MKILFETELLKVYHVYEEIFLVNKMSGEIYFNDSMYGDPQCALIDEHNDWVIIGGENLIIWLNGNVIKNIQTDIKWIHEVRLKDKNLVELLVDPWGEKSSVWELNLDKMKFAKIKVLENLKSEPYSENINW